MMMFLHGRRLWTGMLLCLLAGVACAQGAADKPLVIGVARGTVSLPIYVAASERLFADEGLKVELVDCSSGRDCYRRMVEGQVDLATAADFVVATEAAASPDVAFIATLSASAHQIKLVSRRGTFGPGQAGPRGIRIGTPFGTSAEYFLDHWLLFHDLGPAQAQGVDLPPYDLAAALQRGAVDAVCVWEPLASDAVKALGVDAEVLPSPRVYTQQFGLVVRRQTIATHGPRLLQLLRGLRAAERLIAAEPARAAGVLAARLQIPLPQAMAAMGEHDFRIRLDQPLLNNLGAQQRWMVQRAKPAARAPLRASAVAPELLRAVSPQSVSIAQ